MELARWIYAAYREGAGVRQRAIPDMDGHGGIRIPGASVIGRVLLVSCWGVHRRVEFL